MVISAIWPTLPGQNRGPYIRNPVYLLLHQKVDELAVKESCFNKVSPISQKKVVSVDAVPNLYSSALRSFPSGRPPLPSPPLPCCPRSVPLTTIWLARARSSVHNSLTDCLGEGGRLTTHWSPHFEIHETCCSIKSLVGYPMQTLKGKYQ